MFGRLWVPATLLIACAAAAGCNNPPGGETAASTTGSSPTGAAAGTNGAAAAPVPHLTDLKIQDVKVGKGDAVAMGDTVWVLYTGRFNDSNGKVFDSTDQRDNRPFAVQVGGGQVIQGWEKGLVGMKVGGERNLYIPYNLAYGEKGNDTIPGKSDLFFNIRAVALVKQGNEDLVDIAVKKKGSGPTPKIGDKVTIEYVGKLPTGEEIDKSKEGGMSFTLGHADASGEKALPGIEDALQHMQQGEEAIVTIPPRLGKPAGGPKIPSNSVLVFDLTLKKVG